MTISERIAAYTEALSYESMSEEIRGLVTTAVFNYMGCFLAGIGETGPEIVRKVLLEQETSGKCTLLDGASADPANAALWMATAANAIGFDDMFAPGIYHPGVPAITGALIAAQIEKTDGKRLSEAILAGYEVGCRIAEAINPSHYEHWHTACTVGAIASAVSAGKVLGLTGVQLVSAIGLAATQSCGLQNAAATGAIRLHHGIAARNGITAVLLAREAFEGPANVFEDKGGFVAAFSRAGGAEHLMENLGDRDYIKRTTFKFYPCCGHIHACIDAVILCMEQYQIRPWEVREIKVGSYQTAIFHNTNPTPQNPQEAKFSVEYCCAVGAVYGRCDMEDFDQWPANSQVTAMMARVRPYVDARSEAGYAEGRRSAACTIVTDKGEFSLFCPFRRGDPDCPLDRNSIQQKFLSLARRRLNTAAAERMKETIAEMDALGDCAVLVKI